jgi:inner membrane protease ATP23
VREPPLPQGHMDETLTHELVHSYDYCRAQLDWDNLRHLACTEG